MRRLFALLALATACAGPQATSAPPQGSALEGPGPKEVYLCRYKLNPWHLPDGELRVRGDLPPFATVENARGAGTELTLPWGPARQGLAAKFTSGWVTLRAHFTPRKGLRVVSHEPLAFGSVLAFKPGARLEWLDSAGDGKMLAEVQQPPNFTPTAPLRLEVRCEDTTIGPADRHRSAPEPEPDGGAARTVELVEKVDIPVSATPGGPPEGTLRFEKDDWRDEAVVLGEERGQLKIRKRLWPAVVTGWVPKQHTRATDEKSDVLGGLLGGGLGLRGDAQGSGKPAWPRCLQGVKLYLAEGGRLTRAGEVHKGAAVVEKERLAGWVTVKLPELEWVQLLPGASWALEPGGLEACLAGAPPTPPASPR